MASAKITVQVKREGLLLHLYMGNKRLCTVDLKERLKLSDEQAEQLLAELDVMTEGTNHDLSTLQ
jgi:hypothetical protein